MESIKDCPKCGSKAYIDAGYREFAKKEELFYATVKCTKCDVGRGVITYDPIDAIEEAIFSWNNFAWICNKIKEGVNND